MDYSIMCIPCGFKIRKKVDCDTFIDRCMQKENSYYIIHEDQQLIMDKDKAGNVSICVRYGNFHDPFNPALEVARTKDNCYAETVQYYIWKFRKAINAKWFDDTSNW